ncbi:hypothetical protein DM02DRAFT_659400 [Periconia macrospinosa]|uniref:Uncharacterized protein n=1 Tax=Periconia macrospinosa TaxID=97972 RepID=A0A2V1DDP5_9PLEO|nr:hypothetical protein DM02DRAFT_659400 [Periconia macrospinosa]
MDHHAPFRIEKNRRNGKAMSKLSSHSTSTQHQNRIHKHKHTNPPNSNTVSSAEPASSPHIKTQSRKYWRTNKNKNKDKKYTKPPFKPTTPFTKQNKNRSFLTNPTPTPAAAVVVVVNDHLEQKRRERAAWFAVNAARTWHDDDAPTVFLDYGEDVVVPSKPVRFEQRSGSAGRGGVEQQQQQQEEVVEEVVAEEQEDASKEESKMEWTKGNYEEHASAEEYKMEWWTKGNYNDDDDFDLWRDEDRIDWGDDDDDDDV